MELTRNELVVLAAFAIIGAGSSTYVADERLMAVIEEHGLIDMTEEEIYQYIRKIAPPDYFSNLWE